MKIDRSFIRYVVVGGSAFLIEYALYLLLHRVFKIDYVWSSIIVYSILFWFVFMLNRTWSFESNGNLKEQLFKYLLLFVFNNIAGNVIVMRILTDTLGISSVISPIIKMAVIVIWNFFLYKHFIYK